MEDIIDNIISSLNESKNVLLVKNDLGTDLIKALKTLKQFQVNYDPIFLFIYLDTKRMLNIDMIDLEDEVDNNLMQDYSISNLIEAYKLGVHPIIYFDLNNNDTSYIKTFLNSMNLFLNKYKNKLHFIVIVSNKLDLLLFPKSILKYLQILN